MEIFYAIWLYKEFKHESEAHWAAELYPPKASGFSKKSKARTYAKNTFEDFGWKFQVVLITDENSLEFWADMFHSRDETELYTGISKEA